MNMKAAADAAEGLEKRAILSNFSAKKKNNTTANFKLNW